jgi:hypothetical protein
MGRVLSKAQGEENYGNEKWIDEINPNRPFELLLFDFHHKSFLLAVSA